MAKQELFSLSVTDVVRHLFAAGWRERKSYQVLKTEREKEKVREGMRQKMSPNVDVGETLVPRVIKEAAARHNTVEDY